MLFNLEGSLLTPHTGVTEPTSRMSSSQGLELGVLSLESIIRL